MMQIQLYDKSFKFGKPHLDVGSLIKSVHLVEKFEEDPLNLSIGAGLRVEAFGGDGVDLVDEDDRRTVLLRETENVADLNKIKNKGLRVDEMTWP
jgi:hypothetical protein